MTKKNKKIAVVGAGHNALVCATYLAKAGFSVDVFESRSQVGDDGSENWAKNTCSGAAHC